MRYSFGAKPPSALARTIMSHASELRTTQVAAVAHQPASCRGVKERTCPKRRSCVAHLIDLDAVWRSVP